jgi:hypothetical protein
VSVSDDWGRPPGSSVSAIDTLGLEIHQLADWLMRAYQVGEDQRPGYEARARREARRQIRAHELWVNNGCQRNIGDYLARADEEMTYHFMRRKKKFVYARDGTANIKEALGFLKDWSTSLVQLDLAAIGSIGLFIGFSDFARSPILAIGHLHQQDA